MAYRAQQGAFQLFTHPFPSCKAGGCSRLLPVVVREPCLHPMRIPALPPLPPDHQLPRQRSHTWREDEWHRTPLASQHNCTVNVGKGQANNGGKNLSLPQLAPRCFPCLLQPQLRPPKLSSEFNNIQGKGKSAQQKTACFTYPPTHTLWVSSDWQVPSQVLSSPCLSHHLSAEHL